MANPCWDRFKGTDLHLYLKNKTGIDFDPATGKGKKEFIEAARELQKQTIDTLHDVYAELGVKGFEKRVKPATESKVSPQDNITVGDMIDKSGNYKGERGMFFQDGQTVVFKVEGKPKEYELGNVNEIKDTPINNFDITHEQSVVGAKDNGEITVRGETFKNNFSDPISAINYDKEGNVVSVNLETPTGEKRTFRGNIAEDLAYQIHLKEISKDNETRDNFEQFINEDKAAESEMEHGSLPETATGEAVKDNEPVSRTKIEAKQPEVITDEKTETTPIPDQAKITEPDNQEPGKVIEATGEEQVTKTTNIEEEKGGEDTGSVEPPFIPPVVENKSVGGEPDNWSAIRKEKLKEISGVKQVFEKETGRKWSEIQQSALEDVQKEYPDKTLYEATKSKTELLASKYENGEDYNPTAKDLAVIQEFKRQTEKKTEQAKDRLNSDDDLVRQAAMIEVESYNNDLVNASKALHTREAGTAFGFRQSESKSDANYGLQIRRMELMKAQGGEKLTEEQNKWTQEMWDKEKDLMKKEQDLREQSIREEFDQKIDALKKEYEEKLKKAQQSNKTATQKEKSLSKKGKDVADWIRKLKTDRGSTKLDFSLGTWDLAIEGIAKLVEAGSTVAEAINKLIEDGIISFKTDKDRNSFENKLVNESVRQDKREVAFDEIKKISEKDGITDINNDLVSKNLIKDYVDSHIGKGDNNEILGEATEKLKEILPNVTKEKLVEAYLKKGDFKQPTKRDIQTSIKKNQDRLQKIAKSELTADQNQKIKLQSEKEKAIKDKKEFEKKLAEKEYVESEPVYLKKADAELIKLEKERTTVEAQYRKEQRRVEEKNKTFLERGADFLRGLYIAALIGGGKTFAKIGLMSISRPFSEAATKLTFGKAFDVFFPSIAKAARRGGESSSWRSVQHGLEAYFRQMGPKKMKSLYEKSEKKYIDAKQQYDDYVATENPNPKKLQSLKNNMNNKMLGATGDLMYQFIGGSSIKDAAQALFHRSNEIEKQFGGGENESFKDGNWLDKTNYIINFVGRSHSALKTFSGRFSFAAGFMARLEQAAKDGADLGSSDKILEIAHESYLDWERGKYQQDNYISEKWNHVLRGINEKMSKNPEWDKYNKATSALVRSEVAITRVPVNIIHEAVMEYTFGAFRAVNMARKAYGDATLTAKEEGLANSPEFKQRVKDIVSNMDEKQAATIARAFRKGSMGLGLYALAAVTGMIHFGVFPHMGQPKKKDEEQLGKEELNPGQVQVGDTKLGEVASAMIEHIPALWPMFMGLGMAKVYHDDKAKGKSDIKAGWDALLTHLKVVEGGIPQSKIVSPIKISTDVGRAVTKRLEEWGLVDDERNNRVKNLPEFVLKDYKRTGDEEFLPPNVEAKITYKGHKLDMTDDQKQDFIKMVNEERDNLVKNTLSNSMYNLSSDKERKRILARGYDYGREIAKQKFLEKNKDLLKEANKKIESELKEAEKQKQERNK